MKQIKLRYLLILCFLMPLGLMAAVGYYAAYQLQTASKRNEQLVLAHSQVMQLEKLVNSSMHTTYRIMDSQKSSEIQLLKQQAFLGFYEVEKAVSELIHNQMVGRYEMVLTRDYTNQLIVDVEWLFKVHDLQVAKGRRELITDDEMSAETALTERVGRSVDNILLLLQSSDTELNGQLIAATSDLDRLSKRMYVLLGLVFSLGAGLSVYFSLRLSRTAEMLISVVGRFGKGDFSARAREDGFYESMLLARTYNAMAAELEGLYREMERKVAKRTTTVVNLNDALRTINKILRHDMLNLMVMAQGGLRLYLDSGKKKDLERFIEVSKASTTRGITLITQMKELEAAVSVGSDLEKMDVVRLAREVAVDFKREVPVLVSGKGTARVDTALRVVFANLFRNALLHGKAKHILVEVSKMEAEVVIEVRDDGAGIPHRVKPLLFQEGAKFGETAQNGLGLYIVRKTIERYGGKVEVLDNKPTGAVFVLRIPA